MSCIELKRILDPKNLHANCFSFSSVATEKGKKFTLNNKSNADICKVKIDGCLITNNAIRKCDFFEVRSTTNSYFLVELKGVDLNTAVSQIESTYDLLNATHGSSRKLYRCYCCKCSTKRCEPGFQNIKGQAFPH